jgi:hypothetical protein
MPIHELLNFVFRVRPNQFQTPNVFLNLKSNTLTVCLQSVSKHSRRIKLQRLIVLTKVYFLVPIFLGLVKKKQP